MVNKDLVKAIDEGVLSGYIVNGTEAEKTALVKSQNINDLQFGVSVSLSLTWTAFSSSRKVKFW